MIDAWLLYVDQQALTEEVLNYQQTGHCSERLGRMILDISEGVATRYYYGLETDDLGER